MQYQRSSSEIGDMDQKTILSHQLDQNNTKILVLKRDFKEMMISSMSEMEVESWPREVLQYIPSLVMATIR